MLALMKTIILISMIWGTATTSNCRLNKENVVGHQVWLGIQKEHKFQQDSESNQQKKTKPMAACLLDGTQCILIYSLFISSFQLQKASRCHDFCEPVLLCREDRFRGNIAQTLHGSSEIYWGKIENLIESRVNPRRKNCQETILPKAFPLKTRWWKNFFKIQCWLWIFFPIRNYWLCILCSWPWHIF